MTAGDAVFRELQRRARATAAESGTGAPTQQYLIRHALESFVDRLSRTTHADDFVLKGGILLGAYGVRRPTKDVDSNAVSADVDAGHLAQVVRDAADIDAEDGMVFVLDTIDVQEIREQAAYPGLRVRVAVSIGPWKGIVAWDVSTGDRSCQRHGESPSIASSVTRSPSSGTHRKRPSPKRASPSSNAG